MSFRRPFSGVDPEAIPPAEKFWAKYKHEMVETSHRAELQRLWDRFVRVTGERYGIFSRVLFVLSRKLKVVRVTGGADLEWLKLPPTRRRPKPSAGAGTGGPVHAEEDEELKSAKKLYESMMREKAAEEKRAVAQHGDEETKEDPRVEAERKTMELHLKLRTMYANVLGLANMTGRPLPPGDVPGLLTEGDPPSPQLPGKDGDVPSNTYVTAVVTQLTLALDGLELQPASMERGVKRYLTKALLAQDPDDST